MQGISASRRQTVIGLALLDAVILVTAGIVAAKLRFPGELFLTEMAQLTAHPMFVRKNADPSHPE